MFDMVVVLVALVEILDAFRAEPVLPLPVGLVVLVACWVAVVVVTVKLASLIGQGRAAVLRRRPPMILGGAVLLLAGSAVATARPSTIWLSAIGLYIAGVGVLNLVLATR